MPKSGDADLPSKGPHYCVNPGDLPSCSNSTTSQNRRSIPTPTLSVYATRINIEPEIPTVNNKIGVQPSSSAGPRLASAYTAILTEASGSRQIANPNPEPAHTESVCRGGKAPAKRSSNKVNKLSIRKSAEGFQVVDTSEKARESTENTSYLVPSGSMDLSNISLPLLQEPR